MNPVRMEDLHEIATKIDTELFITQKEKVEKLPSTRGTKMGKKNKPNRGLSPSAIDESNMMSASVIKNEDQNPSNLAVNGVTYRQLKPEVKATLEKIVYQLELVGKTLQLMEQRVVNSEDKMQMIMNYIKNNDLEYVSTLSYKLSYNYIYSFIVAT